MRVFKEEQRFTQPWLIGLIIISTMVPLGIVLSSYLRHPKRFDTFEILGTLGIILIASSIVFFFKLTTKIDDSGIHYQFFPFHWSYKSINWHDMKAVYVRTYDAVTEYGGWGLKGGLFWNKSKGIAINVSGNIGIQLELKDGKKILIGTKRKNDAERIINKYKIRTNEN